jgi:small-conductance mechanosensitive channel
MNASQLIYPLIFIFAIYFVYSNLKNNLKYKKEDMKPLFYLNEDDKTRHLISSIVIIFIIILTGFLLMGIISTDGFTTETFFTLVLLPILMIILYIPLTKKTMISTLGIHKRGALIRWIDIKGINYLKPNEKNQVKAKIIYPLAGRDTSIELTFKKDDSQFESFKETAKEYKSSKKKEKKSGK